MKRTRGIAQLLAGVALLMALPLAAKQIVVLGVTDDASKDMPAVVQHLDTSSAIDVQLKVFPNHDALYRALKEKKVDLGFLGAVKYVEAHFDFGATPVVSEGPTIRSYIVVPLSSAITKVTDLKGKRFAFGYEDSTTTHLIPALLLSKHGMKENEVKASFVGHV